MNTDPCELQMYHKILTFNMQCYFIRYQGVIGAWNTACQGIHMGQVQEQAFLLTENMDVLVRYGKKLQSAVAYCN